MSSQRTVRHLRWNDIHKEAVTDQLSRRLVTGDRFASRRTLLLRGAARFIGSGQFAVEIAKLGIESCLLGRKAIELCLLFGERRFERRQLRGNVPIIVPRITEPHAPRRTLSDGQMLLMRE